MSTVDISPIYTIFIKLVVTNAVKSIKAGDDCAARKILMKTISNIGIRGCADIDEDKSDRVIELLVRACQYIVKGGMQNEAIDELREIGNAINADNAKSRYIIIRESDGDLSTLPYDIREKIAYYTAF